MLVLLCLVMWQEGRRASSLAVAEERDFTTKKDRVVLPLGNNHNALLLHEDIIVVREVSHMLAVQTSAEEPQLKGEWGL